MKYRFATILFCLFPGSIVAAELMVHDAWIREAPPNARALAGYMMIKNMGKHPRTLVKVKTNNFAKVMIHRSMQKGRMMHMMHQRQVVIAAGKQLAFKPGSYHLMLMHPKRRLKSGDRVRLTLVFANGMHRTVTFMVRKGRPDR